MDPEINYQRISRAINYITKNYRQQPHLFEIAGSAHLSAFHFQKLFSEWTGISPKKFLEFTTLHQAKPLLANGTSLAETAVLTGLSGTGRLHDLFIKIEGMTPGEYGRGGENLVLTYSFTDTFFGRALVASTPKGICALNFITSEQDAIDQLKNSFPLALLQHESLETHGTAAAFINNIPFPGRLHLHLKGTAFQLKVWEALLTIAEGELRTYSELAGMTGHLKASRAVGTAIGKNPAAFLIPCHRVIRSNGNFGNYMWGSDRKAAIIGWEACK